MELKPCPFCGGEAEIERSDGKQDYICFRIGGPKINGFSYYWNVSCKKCVAKTYYYRQFFTVDNSSGKIVLYEDGFKRAVEAWNKRVEQTKEV